MNFVRKKNFNYKTKKQIAVSFQGVFKSFDNKHSSLKILKGLSFNVLNGNVLSILGKSGAGKTTVAKIINGLESYDSGSVFINGCYLNKSSVNKIRKNTAFVFQNFNLFPHMSVIDNIMYTPIKVYHKQQNEVYKQAMQLLKQFNLSRKANCLPNELSGGQKQRVAIIRALILNPSILIMDEPTASLDPELKHDVADIIKTINKKGITVIVITHDIVVAKKVSDFVLMLHNGKCVDFMSSADFFDFKKRKSSFSNEFLKNCE